MVEEVARRCNCVGIRFCNLCRDAAYRAHFADLLPIEAEETKQRCTQAGQGDGSRRVLRLCLQCTRSHALGKQVFHPVLAASIQDSEDLSHDEAELVPEFTGLHLIEDFLESVEEEEKLAEILNNDPNWKESQSGRRKIDYGPTANFKKKKIKVGKFTGLPLYSKQFIFDKLESIR